MKGGPALALLLLAPAVSAGEGKGGADYAPLELEPPAAPVIADVGATEHVSYYTAPPPLFVGPGLRVAPGASWRVAGDDSGFAFTLDVLSGARIGLHRGYEQWVLVPEAGYTLRSATGQHQLSAGVGIGRGEGERVPPSEARSMFAGSSWVPKAVFQPGSDGGVGMRNGFMLDLPENTLALELAHQVLFTADDQQHDVRLTASIDLGLVYWLVSL